MENIEFIIDTNVPFKGYSKNTLTANDEGVKTVFYQGEQISFEEYQTHFEDQSLKVVSSDEFDKLLAEHGKSFETDWSEITEDEFQDMYEQLPPLRSENISDDVFVTVSAEATHASYHGFMAKVKGDSRTVYLYCTKCIFSFRGEKIINSLKSYL